jgi:hypothetical protein
MLDDKKQNANGISKFCRAFRPKFIQHDDNLKKDTTQFR